LHILHIIIYIFIYVIYSYIKIFLLGPFCFSTQISKIAGRRIFYIYNAILSTDNSALYARHGLSAKLRIEATRWRPGICS